MAAVVFAIFLVFKPQPWPLVFKVIIGFDLLWSVVMSYVVGLQDFTGAFVYFLYLLVTGIMLSSIGNAIGRWWKSKNAAKFAEKFDKPAGDPML